MRQASPILDRYLHELGKLPLLTAAQEVALAKRIESADKATLDAIVACPVAKQELRRAGARAKLPLERRVVRRIEEHLRAAGDTVALEAIESARRASDAIKAEFVAANLRLVVTLARKHMNHGLDFLDLLQEGNTGLMRAVEKFDHRRGYRFSTYAMWWVRQSMSRAISDKGQSIRLPIHLVETQRKITRAAQRFVQVHGREPSEADLAAATGIEEHKVRAVVSSSRKAVSLDAPMGPESEARVGDFVPDHTVPTPDETLARSRASNATRRLLERLTPRERRVLRLRFGIDEKTDRTLEEVGRELDLTRERIRQIETQALRKLKLPADLAKLRTYLE